MRLVILSPLPIIFCLACGSGTSSGRATGNNLASAQVVETFSATYSQSGGPDLSVENQNITYDRTTGNIVVETSYPNDTNKTSTNRTAHPSTEFIGKLNSWIDSVSIQNMSGTYNGDTSAGGSDFPAMAFVFVTPSKTINIVADTSAPTSLPYPLNFLYQNFLSLSFQ